MSQEHDLHDAGRKTSAGQERQPGLQATVSDGNEERKPHGHREIPEALGFLHAT